jgi:hypothetical protein
MQKQTSIRSMNIIITRKFIMQHRTKGKSWNARQLRILGLSWPPAKSWIKSIIGNQISAEQAERFEMLAGEQAIKRGNKND